MSAEREWRDEAGAERSEGAASMAGERGIAAAYRARSLESRATGVLSLGVMGLLTIALLAWYYGTAMRRPVRAAESARALAASRAQGEMPLPPLPALDSLEAEADRRGPPAPPPRHMLLDAVPGTPVAPPTLPVVPEAVPSSRAHPPSGSAGDRAVATAAGARRRTLDRRLAGPAFTRQSGSGSAADTMPAGESQLTGFDGGPVPPAANTAATATADGAPGSGSALAPAGLDRWLTPASTPAVAAQVLPTQRLLLPKGAFIDCTLETAIDSTLPGMTTCITATDTFGADGRVVLIERGSKLVGETRGEVQQGSARIFVLWTEARTPTGVVVPLASPGTDELGRSGLPGTVNRHFLERFGAALLISVIDAGAEAAVQSRGGGTVIVSPAASQDVASEILKDTLRIPPTVVKRQGDRIQVLVARDIDFRPVYELRIATGRR